MKNIPSDTPDPDNNLDSKSYPYYVISTRFAKKYGIKPGGAALFTNEDNGKSVCAIYGDSSGSDGNDLTEGSIALQNALGGNYKDARHTFKAKIKVTVFPGIYFQIHHFVSPGDIQNLSNIIKP